MFSITQRSPRFFAITLFMAVLALTGCQTAPQKGLTPAQITVLKQQGFELTDEAGRSVYPAKCCLAVTMTA